MNGLEERIRVAAQNFFTNGYAVIESFLSENDITDIKKEINNLIHESTKEEKRNIFGNDFNVKNHYFLDSANKIGYFHEKHAIDQDTGEFLLPIDRTLSKIGHALHYLNPVFHKYTNNDKVRLIFKEINFTEPTVTQSMVIFKNPKIGAEYTPHQDASFIRTEPEIRLVGFWIALDDATPENGCLQFIPGSHKWELKRRFVLTGKDEGELITWTTPEVKYEDNQFVQVPVKKGSLVLIHGLVVHRSARNMSDSPRWAYTFHSFDDTEKSRYSKDNWLQIRDGQNTFMKIIEN
ncbi:Phytanoyl-CoA dioxygenase domain-containing protein 1-like protein, partial [Fragariocoptes setiger]